MVDDQQLAFFGEPVTPEAKPAKPVPRPLTVAEAANFSSKKEQQAAEVAKKQKDRLKHQAKSLRSAKEKLPGSKLDRKFTGNIYEYSGSKCRVVFGTYDPGQRVYQRGKSLSTHSQRGGLSFTKTEFDKLKSKIPRYIEHLDVDHFLGDDSLDLDSCRCWRLSWRHFKDCGEWTGSPAARRWVVPFWAWDVVDAAGKLVQEGTDAEPVAYRAPIKRMLG